MKKDFCDTIQIIKKEEKLIAKTTNIVIYLNKHIKINEFMDNKIICTILTDYIHSSCIYSSLKPDMQTIKIQPAWPEETVVGYIKYYDRHMAYKHHTYRLQLSFESGSTYDISLYKFKKYCKNNRKKYKDLIKLNI